MGRGTVSGRLWPVLACAWPVIPRGVARRNEGVMPARVLDVLDAEWRAGRGASRSTAVAVAVGEWRYGNVAFGATASASAGREAVIYKL